MDWKPTLLFRLGRPFIYITLALSQFSACLLCSICHNILIPAGDFRLPPSQPSAASHCITSLQYNPLTCGVVPPVITIRLPNVGIMLERRLRPTLYQHWVNVSFLLADTTQMSINSSVQKIVIYPT